MVASEILSAPDGTPYVAVYKTLPVWLNIWFFVAVMAVMAVMILGLYLWFRISLKNRTNVTIHYPDGTRRTYRYKYFTGNTFLIPGVEKDQDGNIVKLAYRFDPECVETGYWGRYIDYDYGILEPWSRKKRLNEYKNDNKPELFKFISSLLNTDLAVDLLLSQKFKDFVKVMLVIILIAVCIVGIFAGVAAFYHPVVQCSLVDNNSTRTAITNALSNVVR